MSIFKAPYGLLKFAFLTVAVGICSHTFSTKSLYAIDTADTPIYTYNIINTYPHSTDSFTQGLVFDEGTLYESTGLNGQSAVKIVDLETGKTIKSHNIADKYFGEGITAVGNKIIQLTWRAGKGFVYDKETLKLLKTFKYDTQGWGITYDGKYIIMSDGSDMLYFMDPRTFKVKGTLNVYYENGKVGKLNELEYIDGEIYANVWGTEKIARINPKTGKITAWIDLSGLLNNEEKKERIDVLNGIAYDAENKRLFVTGKLWPKIFEIEVIDVN